MRKPCRSSAGPSTGCSVRREDRWPYLPREIAAGTSSSWQSDRTAPPPVPHSVPNRDIDGRLDNASCKSRCTAKQQNPAVTTEEERNTRLAAVRSKAATARAANAARRKASRLRRDFLDEPTWRKLASERGVRLPPWGEPVTPGAMRRWLKKLSWTVSRYLASTAEITLSDFRSGNPDWPLRAWVGLVLEHLDHELKS
jgi:hypothetical protein